jgi:hypothetical protein
MTKARDTANIVGGGFSGTIAGATMEPTGDTAAGDNAAIGFTAAEGLILTGQGSTGDVTIKNDADALVAHVPTGTTGITFAGDVIVPDGDLILGSTAVTATGAEINLIDGGTARGTTAVADGDGFLTNDGGTMRMTKVDTLATYMGTKITGGAMVFIASSGALSGVASVQFRAQDGHFDATKFDHYVFYFQHVIPATDNVNSVMQTSTNDGSAYASTGGDYHVRGNTDTTGLVVTQANQVGSDTNEFGISGKFHLYSPHTTAFTYAYSDVVFLSDDAGSYVYHGSYDDPSKGSSVRLAAEDVDAVKFLFSSGNIESGEIVMYGIANGS